MTNWRPDEWKNPEARTIEDVNRSYPNGVPKGYHILQEAGYHEGFEDGADAILKCLKEKGKKILADKVVLNDQYGFNIMVINGEGWLVFIEEVKE